MGFFSKITKPFKSIAKRVKRTASSVWKEVKRGVLKPIGNLYAKTFGKLGPLGMIAASFVLPGIGSLISAGWTSALSGGMGSLIQTAAQTMQTIGSTISGPFTGITDKLTGTLTKMGNTVSEGANNLWNKASEWTAKNLPNTHENLTKASDWMSKQLSGAGPKSVDPTQSGAEGLTRTQDFTRAGELPTVAPEPTELQVISQRDLEVFDIDNLPRVQSPTAGGESLLGAPTTPEPQIIRSPTQSGTSGLTRARSTLAPEQAANQGAFSAKKALKAGASLLAQDAPTPPLIEPFITSLPDLGDFSSQRFGVGGTGAVGGQFLTPQQQQFFQQQAAILGQAG